MARKIIAINGSYRKGGTVDQIVDHVLQAASQQGANTEKLYLVDQSIAFCQNCRHCTQTPGADAGTCILDDGMSGILKRIDDADALILGSPMNFGTVTAVTKRFIERTVCLAYWPWSRPSPKYRKQPVKPCVIVSSSAMPSVMARLMTSHTRLLKQAARALGAKSCGVIHQGMSSSPMPSLSSRISKKARRLGTYLAR